jgi:glycosyltransferase involved in cell wall biosynthesis
VTTPLCSVVTPTWQRHSLIFSRCIPSVQAQTCAEVEHVIVSDGPDENLRDFIAAIRRPRHPIRYFELSQHAPEPNFGHYARLHGVEQAAGAYIMYDDDDDELRPEHCALMAAALDADPGAGFAVSRMISHNDRDGTLLSLGWGALACGNVGTPMIAHRRETLGYGTWGPASQLEDWELIQKWLNAGVKHAYVDHDTVDVWPSIYR